MQLTNREIRERIIQTSCHENTRQNSPVCTRVFRNISYGITPFLIRLGLGANQVTWMGFAIACVSAGLIAFGGSEGWKYGVWVLFLSLFFDYTDGNIARFHGTANFYGKFIDGFLDLLTQGLLRLGMAFAIWNDIDDMPLAWVGIISAFIAPIHHLFFDRYSTFARWIRESTGQAIQCSIRSQHALKQMNFLWDLQYLLLIGSCLFLKPCVWGYFGIHIFLGFFYVICHLKAASQNMRIADDAGMSGMSEN